MHLGRILEDKAFIPVNMRLAPKYFGSKLEDYLNRKKKINFERIYKHIVIFILFLFLSASTKKKWLVSIKYLIILSTIGQLITPGHKS